MVETNSEDFLSAAGINDLFAQFNFSNSDLEKISGFLKPIYVPKGDFFIKEGRRCRKLGIVIKGLFISYFETDKKNISRFFYERKNQFVCSFDSFKNETPSNETIEALEDSHIFVIEKKDLEKLYEEVEFMNRIGRIVAEDSYINALRRIHCLQALAPKDRVEDFVKENEGLLNRIKKIHLASYLCMNRNLITKSLKEVFAT